jgi:hypothetical protein
MGKRSGETKEEKREIKKNRKVISIKFNLFNSFKTINVCKLNFEKIFFSDFFFRKRNLFGKKEIG